MCRASLQLQGALQVHNIYMLLQLRACQLCFLLLQGNYLCPQMQNVNVWDQQKFVACLALYCPLTRLCSQLLQAAYNSSLNSGQIDEPMEVCNRQQFSQARWMVVACLSCHCSMRPLLQGDSAISGGFILDMIIAVKLQPTTNNYDECWQVKCARPPNHHSRTHGMFIGNIICS